MKRRRKMWPIVCACVLALLVAGCASQRLPLSTKDSPIKMEKANGLEGIFRFVDDETLKRRYPKESNPFLTDYYTLQFRRIIVFELTVTNLSSEPFRFVMNRLELQYGGKSLEPYNQFQLLQHWEFKDEQLETKAIDKVKRERIVNDNVLPNTITIPPQGKMKGYVVFLGSTPNYGTADVYVPLYKAGDTEAHRFKFSFEF